MPWDNNNQQKPSPNTATTTSTTASSDDEDSPTPTTVLHISSVKIKQITTSEEGSDSYKMQKYSSDEDYTLTQDTYSKIKTKDYLSSDFDDTDGVYEDFVDTSNLIPKPKKSKGFVSESSDSSDGKYRKFESVQKQIYPDHAVGVNGELKSHSDPLTYAASKKDDITSKQGKFCSQDFGVLSSDETDVASSVASLTGNGCGSVLVVSAALSTDFPEYEH